MQIVERVEIAGGWILAALLLLTGAGIFILKGKEKLRWTHVLPALLPAALSLLISKAVFLLVPYDGMTADFPWCFTGGLAGAWLGYWLMGRPAGRKGAEITDQAAPFLCIAMALVRFSQRWIGETGVGVSLEEGFWSRIRFVYVNEWDEPMLAVFLLEGLAALVALGAVLLLSRVRPGPRGIRTARALTFLTVPQVLMEQFRNGYFMRWRMLRVEQVLCGLVILAVLVCLGRMARRRGGSFAESYWTVPVFLLLCGGVALAQYILDGKILEWPLWAGWTLYGLMLLGMPILEELAVSRLIRGPEEGTER